MPDYISVMYRESLKPKTEYPQKLASHLSKRVIGNEKAVLLDVGAGRGDMAVAFAECGYDVCAADEWVDAEFKGEDGTNPRWQNIRFDGSTWDLESSSFDVVFAKSVIEHVQDPSGLLAECKRVLRPGGRLVILTPDWVRNKDRFYDDHTHKTPFTLVSLTNLLLLADFDDILVSYIVPLPATWERPYLKVLSQAIGPLVPPRINWKPLRWSRERQILGTAKRPLN